MVALLSQGSFQERSEKGLVLVFLEGHEELARQAPYLGMGLEFYELGAYGHGGVIAVLAAGYRQRRETSGAQALAFLLPLFSLSTWVARQARRKRGQAVCLY